MQVGEVERHVSVGVEHELTRRFAESGSHAPTQLAVLRVMNDADAVVGRRELVRDLGGRVGRRVVDDQDVVVSDVTRADEVGPRLARGVDGAQDHLLLVPHREDEGEGLERRFHDRGEATDPGSREVEPAPEEGREDQQHRAAGHEHCPA